MPRRKFNRLRSFLNEAFCDGLDCVLMGLAILGVAAVFVAQVVIDGLNSIGDAERKITTAVSKKRWPMGRLTAFGRVLRKARALFFPFERLWAGFRVVAGWAGYLLESRHEVSGNLHVHCEAINVNVKHGNGRPPFKEVGSMQQTRLRGAKPTARHKLAASRPFVASGDTPPQFANVPARLSYWLNNQYGDCVSAEEAFAKACESPEIFLADATVYDWARRNGFLDGAELLDVIHAMQQSGMVQDGNTYGDGSPLAIDYTDGPTLCNAISKGPVKIGVAANQLEGVVGSSNGWVLTGASRDNSLDHCVSLCGYGSMAWLAQQLSVQLPRGVDGSKPGYLLFTWDTVGIIDVASMVNITGEAWLRQPTTLVNGVPLPPPAPPAPPPPDPPGPPVGSILTVGSTLEQGSYALVPVNARMAGNVPDAIVIPWALIVQVIWAIISQFIPTPVPPASRK